MSADNNRRIENLIRFGVIAEVNYQTRRARVQSGEILTDWLPWVAFRAGTTKIWSPVTVGEQCIILSPSGELTTAVILGSIYSLAFDTPSNNPDEHVIEFADGAKVVYDQSASAMKITGISTALLQAETSVTLQTPLVKCTENLAVDGNISANGTISAKDNISTKADVKAGGVSLKNHIHTGDSGYKTEKPDQ